MGQNEIFSFYHIIGFEVTNNKLKSAQKVQIFKAKNILFHSHFDFVFFFLSHFLIIRVS